MPAFATPILPQGRGTFHRVSLNEDATRLHHSPFPPREGGRGGRRTNTVGLLQTLFDSNERDIKKYRKLVDKVNALEAQFQAFSDEELLAKTDEFRQRVQEHIAAQGPEPEDRKEQ